MGSRTERQLLEAIEEIENYVGMRVDFGTGHGFRSPHDAGDLIVGRPREGKVEINEYGEYKIMSLSELYLIEEKYRSNESSKYIQGDPEKFDAMIDFANAIGATPVMACRWSSNLDWSPGAKHLVQHAEDIRRTKSGGINLSPEEVEDGFSTVESFFGGR